jgi:hypothetical protein
MRIRILNTDYQWGQIKRAEEMETGKADTKRGQMKKGGLRVQMYKRATMGDKDCPISTYGNHESFAFVPNKIFKKMLNLQVFKVTCDVVELS